MLGGMADDSSVDVLVAGGGPAGSSVATMLVKRGYRVVVLEKEPHPRFHIGESLLPQTMELLETLGVYDRIERAGFVPKWGASFVLADGEKANTFYFEDGLVPGRPSAFQVLRSRFDHMLLDHSRRQGADLREGHTLRELVIRDDGVQAAVRDPAGTIYPLRARFFADATGRDAFLASRSKTREHDPRLKKVALFAHFEGVRRDEGRDAGNTISVVIRGGWIWFIPLADDMTSIGVVIEKEMFKQSGLSPEQYFERVLSQVPVISHRMGRARRQSIVRSTTDFSYKTGDLYSERSIVLGDAGFFLDPIFSSGVHLAISSGVYGAEAIDAVLRRPGSRRALRRYQRLMRRNQDLYFKFIHGWYTPGFMELLLSPTRRFQMVQAIVSVLAGSATLSWGVWVRLQVFFALAWANRRLHFVPEIDRSQLPPLDSAVPLST
jgi:flavin-dependent dehydrogenase